MRNITVSRGEGLICTWQVQIIETTLKAETGFLQRNSLIDKKAEG